MNGIYEVCGTCAALTTDINKHMMWHAASQAVAATVSVTTPKTPGVL